MSAILHFGTDGWRARLDGDFTEENVVRVVDAACAWWSVRYPSSTIYIGYDTRPGADRFAHLAASVVAGHGLVAKLSDRYTPIPALSWAIVHDDESFGGIMITGSHNPIDYLGVKLRVADGAIGTADFYQEIEHRIDYEPSELRGAYEEADITTPYLEGIAGLVDVEKIKAARLKVVYDPMYGAASGYFAGLLRSIGVETAEIHRVGDPGAENVHPEPIEPWVDDCERAVVATGAHAGLLNDGDADRVGAVDENGRFVSQQKIIALLLGHLVVDRGMTGRVVLNVSSSNFIRYVAKKLSLRVAIKPVGFIPVYGEMRRGGVLIAGEEAGGVAVPALAPERDGLLMNLLLCELMAETGKTLGELVRGTEEACGEWFYARRDLRMATELIEMLQNMLPGLNPPEVAGLVPKVVSHMDGLRLEFEEGSWLLLRPSGTEPVVRVYAEAKSIEMRDRLLDAGSDIAKSSLP